MGQHKGCAYAGVIKKRPMTKTRKLPLRERIREIVAEVMGVDSEEITESYEIRRETDLMPDGLMELIEISVAIEQEYELGEVFSDENERVFENFGTLLEFVKVRLNKKSCNHNQ